MHVALPRNRGAEKLAPGDQRLGFLAAGCDPALGFVGAYLLATSRGRPLEFHYTSPVKPSATHRILYGAELEPYIYCELIGANLIRQSTIEPAFVFTDQPLILAQRKSSSCPIICDGQCHPDFTGDLEALRNWMNETNSSIDLREPFGRIWEALREILTAETAGRAA